MKLLKQIVGQVQRGQVSQAEEGVRDPGEFVVTEIRFDQAFKGADFLGKFRQGVVVKL